MIEQSCDIVVEWNYMYGNLTAFSLEWIWRVLSFGCGVTEKCGSLSKMAGGSGGLESSLWMEQLFLGVFLVLSLVE